MKIALLLTGNLRSWKLCGHVIKNCLINKYDCDVFMSVDLNNIYQHENKNCFDNTNINELNDAISFYNPKKVFSNIGYNENIFEKISEQHVNCILSECPKVELKNSQYLISSFSMNSNIITNEIKFLIKTHAIFEQYYFVKRSYELLEEYINETKTNYDIIIRLRFDQLVWSSDDFYLHLEYNEKEGIMYSEKNIELLKIIDKRLCVDCPAQNEIYVLGCGVHYNYVYVNDQFWIHGKDMITHMKNFYDSLPDIINSCSDAFPSFGANIEHFFALYLKDKKIMKSCISGVFVRSKSNYDL